MALILSIESSTRVCSVALHQKGELLGFSQFFLEKSHSSILTCLINEVLSNSGHEISDLCGVAISEGPGSYTGLRIGTSTAKGICFGCDIPLISVNTLLSMCAGVNKINYQQNLLCPMIDARRMEVYSMVCDHNLKEIREITPVIVDETSFSELLLTRAIFFFGDGSTKCKSVINSPNAVFFDDIYPSARDIGDLAWKKFQKEEFEDVAYFEPFYLKVFKAGKPRQLV